MGFPGIEKRGIGEVVPFDTLSQPDFRVHESLELDRELESYRDEFGIEHLHTMLKTDLPGEVELWEEQNYGSGGFPLELLYSEE